MLVTPEAARILRRPRIAGRRRVCLPRQNAFTGAGSSALVGTHLSTPPSSFDPPTESGAGTAEAKPRRCNYFNSARCWELVPFPRKSSRERQTQPKTAQRKELPAPGREAPVLEELTSRKPLPSLDAAGRGRGGGGV